MKNPGLKTDQKDLSKLLEDTPALKRHIITVLHEKTHEHCVFPKGVSESSDSSAVLFLLREEGMVFNRRSQKVRQPGDLCFPGGRVAVRLDPLLSRLLTLPVLPLGRWPHWSRWRQETPRQAKRLALLLATGLRESVEEMLLNPFGIRFLGPLPSESLNLFGRTVYPMVGWITRQKRFYPNQEVERIVYIPLRHFLNPDQYACYRVRFDIPRGDLEKGALEDFPCFIHENEDGREVLWGVTYRIVISFLQLVLGFNPPDLGSLPVIHGSVDEWYYNGGGGKRAGSAFF